jgi:hypothetical protein
MTWSAQCLLALWMVAGWSSGVAHARDISLFEHCDYQGREARFAVRATTYSLGEIQGAGLPNDTASAVFIPAGYKVTLYEHDGAQGRAWVLTEGVSCLTSLGADNLVSSLKVERLPANPERDAPLDAAPTFVNLLVNPDASAGSMAGWTITANGGNGWRVEGGVFRTSYSWSRRMQTVDLYAAGYSAQTLASAPPIFVSERFQRVYCPDRYYLKVDLLNESQQVVASWNSQTQTTSGECQWGGEVWEELSHVFENYGPGVRYVRWEDGGIDGEFWAGHYGPALDNAVLSVRSPAEAPNLLTNPEAEWGDMSGWFLTENGGNGWAVGGGGLNGSQAFYTSWGWNRRVQEIDLVGRGYATSLLDRAPPVVVSEWFRRNYCPDRYYLKVSLLNASRQVVGSWDSGEQRTSGECGYGGEAWHHLFHVFTGYGPGVRYIRWEDGGVDTEFWWGHYGAVLDDAHLALYAPASPGTTAMKAASLSGQSCGGLNQAPVWKCSEHFWWPPWQWGECRVTSPVCCDGLEFSVGSQACVQKAPTCATRAPSGFAGLTSSGCSTTLHGRLEWSNAQPIANANVRIVDSGGTRTLGRGKADEHGNFELKVSSDFDFSAATYRVRVLLQSGVATFRHPSCASTDAPITFDFEPDEFSRTVRAVGSDVEVALGTLRHLQSRHPLPVNDIWVADIWGAVHDGAAFVRVHGGFEMQRVDICQNNALSGLAYNINNNTIGFNTALRSVNRDVVLHEYGHKLMHEAYGPYSYRDSRCATQHAPGASVDTQCAWVEGWATFFSLAVRNSEVFRYPSGAFFNFNNYTSSVQNGTDEGRVAAALWGIYDRGNASASSRVPFNHIMNALRALRANPPACGGDCQVLPGYYQVLRNELSYSQRVACNSMMRTQYIYPSTHTFPEDREL